jgi:tetratricopeptide (TPR) repeat protein
MHDRFNELLSEYLDDELAASDRAELEAHLTACERCRADLDGLRAVIARAGALTDVPPASDLWTGVAARIGARTLEFEPRPAPRRFAFTLPQLIAASLALMVLSGGMVWLARLGGDRTDFPTVIATDSSSVPTATDAPAVQPANFADGAYDNAIADLQRALESGRGRLDKETIRVLEENLQAIDHAITQCREALENDPANVYLNSHLVEARTRKLELLRRAAAIVDSRI